MTSTNADSDPHIPVPHATSDAALVQAYLGGDRTALAAIYDRYSPGLYDTAAAMLHDRHEAADAMQDVILIAAERLGQLRQPDRLKPWLYAILRNEVYRRSKKRSRAVPTDFSAAPGPDGRAVPELAAPTQPGAEGDMVAAEELAELVRNAARGLDERDQLVLELSVRQGLQGADLAAALGVSPDQSYTMVHRMRERVDRSLGAVVVAKAGRRDCPELAELLVGWDGEFNVLIRKRVARHIERCATCERSRKKFAPIALFGAAPALAAPPGLRDQILQRAGTPGAAPTHAYEFDSHDGFPRLARAARRGAALVASAAAVVLIGAGGAVWMLAGDDDAVISGPAVTTAAVPSTVTDVTSTAPATSTSTSEPAVTSTSEPAAAGALSLNTSTIDLGASGTSAALVITNTGGQPIGWSANPGVAPFAIDVSEGVIQPGATATITVSVQRSGGERDLAQTLAINLTDRVETVALRASVERPPTITRIRGIDDDEWCARGQWFALVEVVDDTAIASVTLSWTGPENGTTTLKGDGSRWTTTLDAPGQPGDYQYTVNATDARGNVGSLTGTFVVEACKP